MRRGGSRGGRGGTGENGGLVPYGSGPGSDGSMSPSLMSVLSVSASLGCCVPPPPALLAPFLPAPMPPARCLLPSSTPCGALLACFPLPERVWPAVSESLALCPRRHLPLTFPHGLSPSPTSLPTLSPVITLLGILLPLPGLSDPWTFSLSTSSPLVSLSHSLSHLTHPLSLTPQPRWFFFLLIPVPRRHEAQADPDAVAELDPCLHPSPEPHAQPNHDTP